MVVSAVFGVFGALLTAYADILVLIFVHRHKLGRRIDLRFI